MLAGVLLDGDAARLAATLDPAFLAEAGWDPVRQMLSLPAGHALLGGPGRASGGLVSLNGLPPQVMAGVLSGLQQRTRNGTKTSPSGLRGAVR